MDNVDFAVCSPRKAIKLNRSRMSSAKWRPFCLSLNVLGEIHAFFIQENYAYGTHKIM